MNTWHKLLDKIINTRLTLEIEEKGILSKHQAGFRKKHSCTTQALALELIIQMKDQEKKPVHAVLIDIKKAFDSI